MFMGKQMILTILIITITFGTETELKGRVILLCSSADSAFMLRDRAVALHLALKLRSAFHLLRIHMIQALGRQIEHNKIQ